MSELRNWSARGPVTLGAAALVVLIGGFGAWSVFSNISGAVVSSGQIEVEQNRQVVQHPDGGVVAEIAVAEGATVQAGDTLIRLDGDLLRSELSIVESQFYEMLARRGRLEAERDELPGITFPEELVTAAATQDDIRALMDGQVRLFETRAANLEQQVEQLGKRRTQTLSKIEGLDAQYEALLAQQTLTASELAAQQTLLDKGLTQMPRVLALQREEAVLRGNIGEIRAARAEAETRVTEIDIEVLQLRSQRREEALAQLRDFGYRELELAERRRALTSQMALLDIRAPVSGVVYGLQVTTPRAVLRAAEPVLYIVPQDRPLVIAAKVSPIEIDQVFVGQPATLMFSAFSSRTTPELYGRVVMVSPDAFTDERSQVSYYRAEIMLNEGEIDKLTGLTLLPGMPVETFIRTDARTPLAYLVKPLSDYFNRAFRES